MLATSKLPLRPRPIHGETLLGYVLRVAATNGYANAKTLRTVFELPSTQAESIRASSRRYTHVIEALSVRVGINTDELHQHFETEDSDEVLDTFAVQPDLLLRPRVCLGCLAEKRPIQRQWRAAHHTHCEHHHQPLQTACVHCGRDFQWSPELLQHCPTCKTPWAVDTIACEKTPAWLSHAARLPLSKHSAFFDTLYHTAAIAMRFYDMQPTPAGTLPTDIADLAALFDFSYRLMTESDFRAFQYQQRVTFWQQQGHLTALDSDSLAMLNPAWVAVDTLDKSTLETDEQGIQAPFEVEISTFQTQQIGSKRLNLASTPQDYHFQLSVTEAAHLFGVPTTALTSLINMGFLQPLINPNTPRQYQLDARDIDTALNRLNTSLATSPLSVVSVTLNDIAPRLMRYDISIGDILNWVIDGRVPAYRPSTLPNSCLGELLIDREALLAEVDAHLWDTVEGPVKRSTTLKAYFANEAQYQDLKDAFPEKLIQLEHGSTCFCVDTLKSLDKDYLVLNRYCGMRRLNAVGLRDALQVAGFTPAFNSNGTRALFIYPRNEALMTTLNSLTQGSDFDVADRKTKRVFHHA